MSCHVYIGGVGWQQGMTGQEGLTDTPGRGLSRGNSVQLHAALLVYTHSFEICVGRLAQLGPALGGTPLCVCQGQVLG
jgi:hypothetical protein